MRAIGIRRIPSEMAPRIFFGLLFLLLARLPGFACSNAFTPLDVGQRFVVEVSDNGKPLPGLKIELSTYAGLTADEGKTVTIITTGANGQATFKAVQPGMYYVAIKHPAASPFLAIRVSQHPNNPAKKLTLEWPGMKFAQARSASGVLNGLASTDRGFLKDLGEPIYRPLVGSKVTLSKAISNEVVGEGVTREEGKFDFRDVPPGSYFLQVEPPPENNLRWMQASGYIPIEVAPHSQVSSLNLALTMAVCGSNAYEQLERNEATNAQAH